MSRRTNRELVMLAQPFNPDKYRMGGMYLSLKYDGMRCVWIPWTKGRPIKDIPFANTDKDNRKHICTGLWSRYGKVIHCPAWFTEGLPADKILDGELYIGRKAFQTLMSICKTLDPCTLGWESIKFLIFDMPPAHAIFQDGRINNPQWSKTIVKEEIEAAFALAFPEIPSPNFTNTYNALVRMQFPKHVEVVPQQLLPFSTPLAKEIIEKRLEEETDLGGEGLMLRHPASLWEPVRSSAGFLMKVKKLNDSEATVVGFTSGLGKYRGMLGSLRVRWFNPELNRSVEFDLSGYTDEERKLTNPWMDWANDHPGDPMPLGHLPVPPTFAFALGEQVTFRYRELSDSGIPKEARFLRKREEV